MFLDNMQGAIEKALAEKGYTRVTFGIPDLLVHYHAAASQRIDAGLLARERAACHGGAYGARAIDNEAATLVVDIVDSGTDELVWRGWAQNDLDSLLGDHRRMVREINEAVQRMMAQLPGDSDAGRRRLCIRYDRPSLSRPRCRRSPRAAVRSGR